MHRWHLTTQSMQSTQYALGSGSRPAADAAVTSAAAVATPLQDSGLLYPIPVKLLNKAEQFSSDEMPVRGPQLVCQEPPIFAAAAGGAVGHCTRQQTAHATLLTVPCEHLNFRHRSVTCGDSSSLTQHCPGARPVGVTELHRQWCSPHDWTCWCRSVTRERGSAKRGSCMCCSCLWYLHSRLVPLVS